MSTSLTSKHSKQAEHDGIEEAKAHGQGVLMDDGGDDEHGEHGSCSEFPVGQLQGSERERLRVQGSGQFSVDLVSVELQHSCE